MATLTLLQKNHPELDADFSNDAAYELGETDYVFWSVHERVEGEALARIFCIYWKYVRLQTRERWDDEETFKRQFQQEIDFSTQVNEAFFRAIDRDRGGW